MPKSFDRIADIYDDTRRMPPEVVAGIMENIRGEIKPSSGRVIELGIGTGRIALPLAGAGFRIVGVDVAEKMLSRLRENTAGKSSSIRAVRGDVTALPFAADSFSAAIAVHVFHLLDDMEACVNETRRVLSPGGCLLFGGEQRLFRYVEKVGLNEDFTAMLMRAGIKLPDQAEVERKAAEYVRGMGGDVRRLRPVEWDFEISCAGLTGRIENRAASYLWDASDDAIDDLVEKLRALLETHMGPPSTMIRFRRTFNMFCARF